MPDILNTAPLENMSLQSSVAEVKKVNPCLKMSIICTQQRAPAARWLRQHKNSGNLTPIKKKVDLHGLR